MHVCFNQIDQQNSDLRLTELASVKLVVVLTRHTMTFSCIFLPYYPTQDIAAAAYCHCVQIYLRDVMLLVWIHGSQSATNSYS